MPNSVSAKINIVLGGGGGIFIYMIKNGEFYLGGFFPGGIFSRAKGDFSRRATRGFFPGDFYRVPSRSLPLD